MKNQTGYNYTPMDAEEYEKLLEEIERDEELRMSPEGSNDPENLRKRQPQQISVEDFNNFLRQCNEDEVAAMTAYYQQQAAARRVPPAQEDELEPSI